jgi:uncharacterized membrane protein HdeD (DUF308 family)
VIHLFYAWSDRGAGAVLWQILIGIAYLIAALYLLRLPVAGVVTLTLVLAFYIIVGAIFELAVFFRLRGLRGTVWFLVDGLVSLLLAGSSSFIGQPIHIGALVGISVLCSGIARITLPLGLRILGGYEGVRGTRYENSMSAQ